MPGGDDDDLFDDVEDEGHAQCAYGGETDGCTGEVPMERGENESHEDPELMRVSITQGEKPFTLFTQEGSNAAGHIYNVENAGVRRISEAGGLDDSRQIGVGSISKKDSFMQQKQLIASKAAYLNGLGASAFGQQSLLMPSNSVQKHLGITMDEQVILTGSVSTNGNGSFIKPMNRSTSASR